MPHHLTAHIRATEGSDPDLVRQELAQLEADTQKELGCLTFQVFQDAAAPTRFILWESWISPKALDQHFTYAHTQRYMALNLTQVEKVVVHSPVNQNAS
ncbi:antibiotic biosynthesis monooxygenase [Hahella sp. KA22]|uniref:putative quinol monooxygenase n=1 Tax=Hahella sp. KA22 TaxID=1628392 RepID=UPI000FDD42C0|nr:putative quinol monooxygenase [Hahella sp. KA22]AZZ93154.1 antibiotic biosynthesis monooxygenase [Hahella sp. KA22]QAY56528.1 antibiotic biosynthesis monooxygenase [Hahella sp. KA22]